MKPQHQVLPFSMEVVEDEMDDLVLNEVSSSSATKSNPNNSNNNARNSSDGNKSSAKEARMTEDVGFQMLAAAKAARKFLKKREKPEETITTVTGTKKKFDEMQQWKQNQFVGKKKKLVLNGSAGKLQLPDTTNVPSTAVSPLNRLHSVGNAARRLSVWNAAPFTPKSHAAHSRRRNSSTLSDQENSLDDSKSLNGDASNDTSSMTTHSHSAPTFSARVMGFFRHSTDSLQEPNNAYVLGNQPIHTNPSGPRVSRNSSAFVGRQSVDESYSFTTAQKLDMGARKQTVGIATRLAEAPKGGVSILFSMFFDVIEMNARWKYFWDWGIILLTFYSLFMTPVKIAFANELAEQVTLNFFESIVDICFIVDIFFNFRTAYLDEDCYEVSELRDIARRYLYGWFTLDALAAIPFQFVTLAFAGKQQQYSDIYSILQVNKLFRSTRVVRKLDDMATSQYARIVKLLLVISMATHLVGCSFFALGKYQSPSVIGGTWLDEYGLHDKPWHYQYMTSMYWAFATLSTVGYGDITALSFLERSFALVTMFFGSVMYASIFGTFTTLIQQIDKSRQLYLSRVSDINEFCKSNRFPSFVKQRLLHYLDASWQLRRGITDQVFQNVPECAQMELLMFLYADMVTQVPLFSACNRRFLEKVVMCFKHECFLAGDYIIRQGDIGTKLYFVVRGFIAVYSYAGSKDPSTTDFSEIIAESFLICERGPGSFVGETALLSGEPRSASVIADSPIVHVTLLSQVDFDRCVQESPDVLKQLKGVSELRKQNRVHSSQQIQLPKTGFQEKMQSAIGFRHASMRRSSSLENMDASARESSRSFQKRRRDEIDELVEETSDAMDQSN